MKDRGTEIGGKKEPTTLRVEERGRMKRILGSTLHGEANGRKSREGEKAPEKPRRDETYKENYSL